MKFMKPFVKVVIAFMVVAVMVVSTLAAYGFFNNTSYTPAQEMAFIDDDYIMEISPLISLVEQDEYIIEDVPENQLGFDAASITHPSISWTSGSRFIQILQNTRITELNFDEFEIWVDEWLVSLHNEGVSADEIAMYRERYMNLLEDARGTSETAQIHREETLQRLQELPEIDWYYFAPIDDYITRDERIMLFEENLTGADYDSIMEKLASSRK